MGTGHHQVQRKEKGTHSEKRYMQRPGVRKVVAPGGCYVVSDRRGQKGGGGVVWGGQVLGPLNRFGIVYKRHPEQN